jgi:hypothetical protein
MMLWKQPFYPGLMIQPSLRLLSQHKGRSLFALAAMLQNFIGGVMMAITIMPAHTGVMNTGSMPL